MPGSDGRKMFMVSADSPASSVRVTILGGVLRSRKRAGVCFISLGYASWLALSIRVIGAAFLPYDHL